MSGAVNGQEFDERRSARKKAREEADQARAQLDHDLDLGLGKSGVDEREFSLFNHQRGLSQFLEKIEVELQNVPNCERLDLAVAFLEMEFYAIAAEVLEGLLRAVGSEEEALLGLSARQFLAYSYLALNKPHQAQKIAESVVYDEKKHEFWQDSVKIEFYYLLGLVAEELGQKERAQSWFDKVAAIDPYFRDLEDYLANAKG